MARAQAPKPGRICNFPALVFGDALVQSTDHTPVIQA
jgi:hypothetical protein